MIRLLHINTRGFTSFPDLRSVPEYAILSHRWIHTQRNGQHVALDISYTEFLAGSGDQRGYEKIDKACEAVLYFAHEQGRTLEWIWIDSCCIDKSNNEEHTEAINSMYQWYARSYVCITYLGDVDTFDEASSSEWFRRGWTLQELIAPERVLFYNKRWQGCGSKNDYSPGLHDQTQYPFLNRSKELADITNIDIALLRLQDRKAIKTKLDSIPACQKMSWASDRNTTKDEDMAYCMIGIFDISHMYLKRGEGRRAFIRLQEEVIKQSNDLTLFAWKLSDDNDACMEDNCLGLEELSQNAPKNAPFFDSNPASGLHGIFACGPSHFRHASQIEPTQLAVYNEEITITSRGVKFITPLLGTGPFFPFRMPLYCTDGTSSQLLSIELRLLGGSIYARANCTQLPLVRKDAKVIPNQDDVFLAHKIRHFQHCAEQMHKHAIRLPESILKTLHLVHVSPGYLWSSKHNLVTTNGRRFFIGCAYYQTNNTLRAAVTLLFGLDHLQRPWFCLSNTDPSFESHSLESRKLYLERVWRRASQHTQTVCLDDEKPFRIYDRLPQGLVFMIGSMRANCQRYCDQDIYDLEFLRPGERGPPLNSRPIRDNRPPSPDVVFDAFEANPVGLSNGPEIFFEEIEFPSLAEKPTNHHVFSDSFTHGRPVDVPVKYPVSSNTFNQDDAVGLSEVVNDDSHFPMPTFSADPTSANSVPFAIESVEIAQHQPLHHMSPGGSPYRSIGITPQIRPFPAVTGKLFNGPPDLNAPPYQQVVGTVQAPGRQDNRDWALQGYQMQLMLLEQQNKKRLLMARQEQDSILRSTQQQGQQQPQQAHVNDLASIAEQREETPSIPTNRGDASQGTQDLAVPDLDGSQNETRKKQRLMTITPAGSTHQPSALVTTDEPRDERQAAAMSHSTSPDSLFDE
jgi:hypothetical protein